MKIFELAKRLGMDSRDILEKARDLGISAPTNMSTLREADLSRLLAYLDRSLPEEEGKESGPAPLAPEKAAKAAPSRSPKPAGTPDGQAARDRRRRSRDRKTQLGVRGKGKL